MKWSKFLTEKAPPKTDEKMELARQYLRLDTEDDDLILFACLKAAIGYVKSAVGIIPEGDSTADILILAITQDIYDNRELMQLDIQQRKAIEYTYKSIILQLQTRYDLDPKEAT